MSKEVDYFKEKLRNLTKKGAIGGGGILLLVLVILGYFRISRPVIIIVPDCAGIHVRNQGAMNAVIYKVDTFWYWAGQVALLGNMPEIHQRVESEATPVRLQVPDIPGPAGGIQQREHCYMKLAVRYRIPGVPVFRYTTLLYFKYDPDRESWISTKSIPAKYRSLGSLGVGNVGKLELSFH